MSKVIGIDYGKRIGIAISDIDQKIAFPLKTVENNKTIEILKKSLKVKKYFIHCCWSSN